LLHVSERKSARGPRVFRKLVKLLSGELKLKLPRISAYDYIDRFAPQLGLSREAIERAHKFYKALPRNFTQSKSPLFLAAMALYIAAGSAGEKITLDKVARTVGVGISGISKNLKRARQLAARE
jgi:transcription initiation factor TFIIIB Brf1 subunit/transcription initiation factor TFIIB